MIRSKYMSGIVWLAVLLTLQVWPGMVKTAQGQGTRKDDIVFNSRGVPLAGATVRICAMPASGQPCMPLALIYSDPGLTQALANPTMTDGLGNYFFYAAPGKYEVEISGPGITTKQLPNVIVPSDPSSPSFSSVSTSGGINAFSLSLTGNLTVNGSTTVVGNLASGTLNLSNQGTAPGTPGAGTINLYTKSVDKRLYYKDETGTEIGPIASSSGAQTNVANTFTAAQTIDADFHTKGPNPSYDILRYGGYLGPNYLTGTTGSISSGAATLTLASALDFANGQGVLVLGAGAAPTIPTPDVSTSSATAVGATGSSTYNYCIVDEDYAGGRTACSAAVQVTNAVATLGLQNLTTVSWSRTAGVVTVITTAAHNIISGSQIELQRSTFGNFAIEGAFTTTSASGTTFTFNQFGAPDVSTQTVAGTVRVAGRVFLKWKADSGATAYNVLKHRIYRCTTTCTLPGNAANYSYIGTAVGFDTSFLDAGYPVSLAGVDNGDVPATAPTTASNKWLSTTIANGGGSTALTLAANATSTVLGAPVFHDNAPNILNLCQNTPTGGGSNQGALIYVPSPLNSANFFPIASTLNLGLCPSQLEINLGSDTYLKGPIIPKGGGKIKGVASGNTVQTTNFYGLSVFGNVLGHAYPMFYLLPGTSSNTLLESLIISCPQVGQVCIYADLDTTGGGETSVRYADVHTTAGNYSTSYVQKGGFGYFWDRGGWGSIAQDFSSPPGALFTLNCGFNQSGQLLPGILYTDHTYAFGGILMDTCGVPPVGLGTGGNMTFRDLLIEGGYGPAFRVTGGTAGLYAVDFYTPSYADYLGGGATPLLDIGVNVAGMRIIHPFCGDGNQPIFGTVAANYQGIDIDNGYGGCSLTGLKNYILHDRNSSIENYSNANIDLQNSSRLYSQMAVPGIAQSAVVSAGGAVPLGVRTYNLTAVDFDGGETTFGPAITATTTTGNQTVTLTMPATFPTGAAGLNIYRDGVLGQFNSCFSPQTATPGGTVADTASFACGTSQPLVNTAGASALSSNGLSGFKVRIGGEALTAAPRSEQNLFLPGALTSTWTSSTWTLDKAVTVTRIQAQAKTAPATCSPNAILRLTDGTTPVNLTVAAAANDSGAITQNYATGSVLTFSVQTAAAGCGTSPADVNVTIQYRMQ